MEAPTPLSPEDPTPTPTLTPTPTPTPTPKRATLRPHPPIQANRPGWKQMLATPDEEALLTRMMENHKLVATRKPGVCKLVPK